MASTGARRFGNGRRSRNQFKAESAKIYLLRGLICEQFANAGINARIGRVIAHRRVGHQQQKLLAQAVNFIWHVALVVAQQVQTALVQIILGSAGELFNFAQTCRKKRRKNPLCPVSGETMLTSAVCRKHAEQKIAEAERESRHSRRLINAAECWLVLASAIRHMERAAKPRQQYDAADSR